jgi:type IV pilus assembly protein PilF
VKKRAALILVAASFFTGCATAPTVDTKAGASAHMQLGISYLRQNNIPMAMRELSEASQLDPDNPEVDLGFGFAYQARGEHNEAEKHFRNAIRKKRNYPEAHNGLGSSLSFQGKSAEALKEFEIAAHDVYYNTPDIAWYNMGQEYRRMRDFRKADEMYAKALAANDRNFDAHLMRVATMIEDKRVDDAASWLELAISRNPSFIQGQIELGKIYMMQGRKDAARKAFTDASAASTDIAVRRQMADFLNKLESGKR